MDKLQEEMQAVILDHLRTRLELFGRETVVVGTESGALLMQWILDHQYVPRNDIAQAIHDRLCDIGRRAYEWHIGAPERNHLKYSGTPVAFGHALLHGTFSDTEVSRIRFCSDETVEWYRKMGAGTVEMVLRKLARGETFHDANTVVGAPSSRY